MISENRGFRGLVDTHNPQLRAMLRNVPAAEQHTNQPEVFRYGVYRGQEEHEVLYRLLFYGGVDIYAFGATPEQLENNPQSEPNRGQARDSAILKDQRSEFCNVL